MIDIADIVWVGLAGGAGAAARFGLDTAVRARVGGRFPTGTVIINLTGSALLGLLTGLVLDHGAPSELTVVAGTGFCGGYTTFSTASIETVRLIQTRAWSLATLSGIGSMVGCVAAGAVGLVLGRL